MESHDSESIEDLQSKISTMRYEMDLMKRELHEVRRELRDEKNRCAALSEKSGLEHQELSDLRELISHQQNNVYQSDVQEMEIEFPYTVSSNMIVFGGHDSWLREIKQKVINVRFMGKDQLPNAEMIRRADMVWIQSNALSHAFFYKIINEVRKNGIPLRYFTYASAIKCAEELVKADQKHASK